MKSISGSKSALLALVVMSALGALGVASASAALPEFNPAPGIKEPFSFEIPVTHTYFEAANQSFVTCTGENEKMIGQITGAKTLTMHFRMPACYSQGANLLFYTHREPAYIESEALTGTLAYVNKATHTVAISLEGAHKTGEIPLFAKLRTVYGSYEVRGRLAVGLSPVNKTVGRFQFELKQQKAVQEPSSLEGIPFRQQLEWLQGGAFEDWGVGAAEQLYLNTIKTIEIKA